MDNITHGLAGLLLAETASAIATRQTGRRPDWRGAACFTSILAQNLPDSDFLLVPLTGGVLGYLVQHRGYTHTLLAALPLSLLAMLPSVLWMRLRRRVLGRGWLWVGGLALLGGMMHIAMDGTNDYGVHPWWPFDPRWVYGDAVFIIEPLLWASSIGVLLWTVRTRAARIALLLPLAAILSAAALIREYVRVPTALTLVVYTALIVLLAWRLTPSRRPWLGVGAWALVTAVFFFASSRADHAVRAAHAELHPSWSIHDVVLTPAPADPFCWRALTVATSSDSHALSVAVVSLWPSMIPASTCPRADRETTAPVVPAVRETASGVRELATLTMPLDRVRATLSRCDVDTFLRWSRAPYWMFGERWILGDLRYDREAGLGFAELEIPREPPAECPKRVPTWKNPRSFE